jgi:hypothetical protein
MDSESASTQLRIYFGFAESENRTPSDEDVEFVKSVLESHDLSYDHYDEYNISTNFFVDSDENMDEVDDIKSTIGDYFDEYDISRIIVDDEIYGSEPGTYQTWISIE